MKITYLGQAGLLIEACCRKILIDPYLSDSCGAINPASHRRVPVDERFLALKPDFIICTHDHMDHLDVETLGHYLTGENAVTVLAGSQGWPKLRATFGGPHNYILFDRHTEWTESGIRFIAVKAVHSEPYAIGVIVEAEGKRLYITGDTLYSTDLFADLFGHFDAVFLPVNGVGNNMNMEDAARFTAQLDAAHVVPLHVGLFDDKDAHDFADPRSVVPVMWEQWSVDSEQWTVNSPLRRGNSASSHAVGDD